MLIDAVAMGTTPAELSRDLLQHAAIAATPMLGWGGEVADRHVRLVYSAESLDRLRSFPERLGNVPRSAAT
jgi:aspartate/methionine/tyrosine aminotransferase